MAFSTCAFRMHRWRTTPSFSAKLAPPKIPIPFERQLIWLSSVSIAVVSDFHLACHVCRGCFGIIKLFKHIVESCVLLRWCMMCLVSTESSVNITSWCLFTNWSPQDHYLVGNNKHSPDLTCVCVSGFTSRLPKNAKNPLFVLCLPKPIREEKGRKDSITGKIIITCDIDCPPPADIPTRDIPVSWMPFTKSCQLISFVIASFMWLSTVLISFGGGRWWSQAMTPREGWLEECCF